MTNEEDKLLLEFIKLREKHVEDNIQKVYTRIGLILSLITILVSVFVVGLERSVITVIIFSGTFLFLLITILIAMIGLFPFEIKERKNKPGLNFNLKVKDLVQENEKNIFLKSVT